MKSKAQPTHMGSKLLNVIPHRRTVGSMQRHSYLRDARSILHSRDDPMPMGVKPERLEVHRKAIETLRKDNAGLKHELLLTRKHEAMISNPTLTTELKGLDGRIDTYTRKVQSLRLTIKEIETQISTAREQQLRQRRTRGGEKASLQNNNTMAKQIKILEKRLEKLLLHFNRKIAANRDLRVRIDCVRKERVAFDQVFKKMEHTILGFDRAAQVAERTCGEAMKECENERYDLNKIRNDCLTKTRDFEATWRQQHDEIESQVMDATVKMGDARKTVGAHKTNNASSTDTQSLSPSSPSATTKKGVTLIKSMVHDTEEPHTGEEEKVGGQVGGLNIKQEKVLKRSLAQNRWAIMQKKINVQHTTVALQNYEELFQKLEEATGICDANELAREFAAGEERVFSIFKHISLLEEGIDNESRTLVDLKKEIAKATMPHSGGGTEKGNRANKLVDHLSQQLADTERRTQHFQEKTAATMTLLQVLKPHIERLFHAVGCDKWLLNSPEPAPVLADALQPQMEGREGRTSLNNSTVGFTGDSFVRETSTMQQLGMIESRARELLKSAGLFQTAPALGAEERTQLRRTIERKVNRVLNKDPIFRDDFSDDEVEGGHDSMPMPLHRTTRTIHRHFERLRTLVVQAEKAQRDKDGPKGSLAERGRRGTSRSPGKHRGRPFSAARRPLSPSRRPLSPSKH